MRLPTFPTLLPSHARLERELKHPSPLIGCRFDPSGRFLFASSQDDTILRYDLLTGAKVALAGHQSWVRGMAFIAPPPSGEWWEPSPTERVQTIAAKAAAHQAVAGIGAATLPMPKPPPFTLVAGDYHGKLTWWPGAADSPKPLHTVEAHEGWVRAVAVNPDGTLVASCGNDNAVRLWSAADGSPIRTFVGHTSHVYNVAFHPTQPRLVSADLKGIVKDWDIASGNCLRELDAKVLHKYDGGFLADIGGARGMAFDATGSQLACVGITNVSNAFAGVGNPLVVVFDWDTGAAKQRKPREEFQGTGWGVAFHPAGFVIGCGGAGQGRIWFWLGDDPASSHSLNVPANARDLALSPLGDRFAVAGYNGSAYVYTFGTRK